MCTCYPIINRVSELKVHIELTRFVQPEKIEIDANERAVNEKSQYCFFVCTTFDSFLNDLSKIPANITKIAFTVTIYDAEARRQNFGQVSNAFVRIFNEVTGEEILRYDLGEDFSNETAVVFGELYKNGDEWKFNAIGSGYQGGLAALCNSYGVDVE